MLRIERYPSLRSSTSNSRSFASINSTPIDETSLRRALWGRKSVWLMKVFNESRSLPSGPASNFLNLSSLSQVRLSVRATFSPKTERCEASLGLERKILSASLSPPANRLKGPYDAENHPG